MRLATFNILHGRAAADDRVDLDRFAAAVRSIDADVLALQEVDLDQPRSHLADLTAVAVEAMQARSHRFVAALAGTPGATWVAATGDERPGEPLYGIALLSRYPASSWQVIRLPTLPLFREEPRVAVSALVETPYGAVTVVSTHLSFVPVSNRRQLRRLVRDLAPLPDPLVLLGDLNLSGTRPATITGYRSLASVATFPADQPVRQLDHVLLRGATADVDEVRAVQLPISDHRPLTVTVRALRA